MKYRKKPIVIEAVQYDGTNMDEIVTTLGMPEIGEEFTSDDLLIQTLEGEMRVSKGDYVIKGVIRTSFLMKDLVISFDLAKRLYEAGFGEKSKFKWLTTVSGYRKVVSRNYDRIKFEMTWGSVKKEFPALTLEELMLIMPHHEIHKCNPDGSYSEVEGETHYTAARWTVIGGKAACVDYQEADRPLKALEALAVYLLDNNLWK